MGFKTMNEEKFWQVIEESKSESKGNTNAQLENLQEKLESLSPDEIVSFDKIFTKFYWQSYDWKLWAAAYIIDGGCSDDGFDYFRSGLILQGEKVFTDALANPESLIDVIKFEGGDLAKNSDWATGVEEFLYLPSEIYEEKTGEEFPREHSSPREPFGESWDEDEVEELLPNLAKYCEEGMN
jgi:Protein of unknown function (DUF4240)